MWSARLIKGTMQYVFVIYPFRFITYFGCCMARILIVDDSHLQKVVMTKFLLEMGHEVIEASDGNQAFHLATQTLPHLILMDIVMPDCNGFQATRRLHKQAATKHIPIIMVSTKSLEVDKLWALRQGASAYLTKPINRLEFIDAVKQVLEKHVPDTSSPAPVITAADNDASANDWLAPIVDSAQPSAPTASEQTTPATQSATPQVPPAKRFWWE